ncbi:hypothetical protein Lpar_1495 [Legionella parisiensis]|uniref:Uncharacterized protein n=1 Tax=Legionella parisiensis TaxID=45071 RepID=A0A1E5JQL1_9GAMM|nr:hypothetical protein Lpar_1495 [Legionella parisiensis]OEH46814.1 hypothetical protein lpari_02282 [Legionella parisiensis]STX77709.1 Uncharacterised protein [Legionella parisiensis]
MSDSKFVGGQKKIALVDIDGCLLINGELNINLFRDIMHKIVINRFLFEFASCGTSGK